MAYFINFFVSFLLVVTFQNCKGLKSCNSQLPEDVKTIFHQKITDVPKVSKYNSVRANMFLSHRKRRDTEYNFYLVQFEIDRKKYNLKLTHRKRSVFTFLTPVWQIIFESGWNKNHTYKVLKQEDKYFDGIFFEDEKFMAMLSTHYDKEKRQLVYDGIFGLGTDIKIIRSVPAKLQTVISSLNNCKIPLNECYAEHVLYKMRRREKESRSLFLTVLDSQASDKLDIFEPLILHVKVVPIIDYELFKLLGKNIQETLKYVATFWNAVDTRFIKIDSLKTEIMVTGIVIASDENSFSFIDKTRDQMDSRKINAYTLLEEARVYFYENFIKDTGLTNYDAIFLMTALNTKPSAGMSYIGRICNRLYSTAFVQDDANFLGLHSAIHELGHLLNFVHDGSEDAKVCTPYGKNGEVTVMAPYIATAKSLTWSNCSENSLKKFVKTKASKCLYETFRIK